MRIGDALRCPQIDVPLVEAFELFVFDFDGTLVDSDHIKTAVLKNFIERWNTEMVSPLETDVASKMTRFELIQAVCNGLTETKRKKYQITEDLLLREISSEIESAVAGCKQFDNASNLLFRLRAHAPVHLVSRTPELELIRQVIKFGWSDFFDSVHGGESSKIEHLKELRKGLQPSSKCLHIGNTCEDFEASVRSGYWHLNVINGDKPIEPTFTYFVRNVRTLVELEAFLFG